MSNPPIGVIQLPSTGVKSSSLSVGGALNFTAEIQGKPPKPTVKMHDLLMGTARRKLYQNRGNRKQRLAAAKGKKKS